MPVATQLEITVRHAAGTALVALRGELDLATAPQLEQTLELLEGMPVIVDLRELGYLDSVGLQLLLRRDARAQERGQRLTVVPGAAPAVSRVFELTEAHRILNLV